MADPDQRSHARCACSTTRAGSPGRRISPAGSTCWYRASPDRQESPSCTATSSRLPARTGSNASVSCCWDRSTQGPGSVAGPIWPVRSTGFSAPVSTSGDPSARAGRSGGQRRWGPACSRSIARATRAGSSTAWPVTWPAGWRRRPVRRRTEERDRDSMYTAQGTLDRQEAIEQYGTMVRRVAHQMVARLPPNVDVDDLIQAGMIGLFDAMSRYVPAGGAQRSEEHTSELQSRENLVCRLLLEKKKKNKERSRSRRLGLMETPAQAELRRFAGSINDVAPRPDVPPPNRHRSGTRGLGGLAARPR